MSDPAVLSSDKMVAVGSPEFFRESVQRMPAGARLGLLDFPEDIRNEPFWIDALHDAGVFSLKEHTDPPSPRIVRKESASIMRLALALTWPDQQPRHKVDPISAEDLYENQLESKQVHWTPAVKAAFARVVDDFIAEAPSGTHWKDDAFLRNAALLFAAACAAGEIQPAEKLFKKFPESVDVPLSSALLHFDKGLPTQELAEQFFVSPPALAVSNNQPDMLRALAVAGWDPLQPIMWQKTTEWKREGLADPAGHSIEASGFASALNDERYPMDWAWPSTIEFFLEAYVKAKPKDRIASETSKLEGIAVSAVEGAQHENLLGPMHRSGLLDLMVGELAPAAAECRSLEAFQLMRSSIKWASYEGDDFLPWRAYRGTSSTFTKASPDQEKVALSIATMMVEDGHAELLTELPDYGYSSATYAVHPFARGGHKEMVLLALENGHDPMAADKDGNTTLSSAIEGGHENVIALIRSHMARKAAMAVIDNDLSMPAPHP